MVALVQKSGDPLGTINVCTNFMAMHELVLTTVKQTHVAISRAILLAWIKKQTLHIPGQAHSSKTSSVIY